MDSMDNEREGYKFTGPRDDNGIPIIYNNKYSHCNTDWEDEHSCACNDRCPVCDAEIEPYESEDINQEDYVEIENDHSFEQYIDSDGDFLLPCTEDFNEDKVVEAVKAWLKSDVKEKASQDHLG